MTLGANKRLREFITRQLRDPEQFSDIEPADREHAADALELMDAIPRMVVHLLHYREFLNHHIKEAEATGNIDVAEAHMQRKADINNVLAGVQFIPEMHDILFGEDKA